MSMGLPDGLAAGPKAWTSPDGLSSTLQVMLLLAVLSLAAGRFAHDDLLRPHRRGAQLVAPGHRHAKPAAHPSYHHVVAVSHAADYVARLETGLRRRRRPYTQHRISAERAWEAGVAPVRRFMSMQIEKTHNTEDVWLFMSYLPHHPKPAELRRRPVAGPVAGLHAQRAEDRFPDRFQIYLPFLILDMVVASVMVSMGMLMLPPVLISLPFKLLLFVLVDGWRLVVGMLLQSFQAFT